MFAARRLFLRTAIRRYSTEPAAAAAAAASPEVPPLLTILRNDLKASMRSKNRARLDVVKAILAQITNASKTAEPVKTDIDILQLINRARRNADESIREAHRAKRPDIVEKEKEAKKIYDEFANQVVRSSEDEMREVALNTITKMANGNNGEIPGMGQAMKYTKLEMEEQGKAFLKEELAEVVRTTLKRVKELTGVKMEAGKEN